MQLSVIGKIINDEWLKTSSIRNNVILDEFMVMPNHIHIIIFITEPPVVETHCHASQSTPFDPTEPIEQTEMRQSETETHVVAETRGDARMQMQYKNSFGPQSNNLSSIIRGFKGATTANIHIAGFRDFKWQPRFYDRIIRNELELNNERDYIIENPAKWWRDRNNKENLYM